MTNISNKINPDLLIHYANNNNLVLLITDNIFLGTEYMYIGT